MNETLVQTLARLEREIKEIKTKCNIITVPESTSTTASCSDVESKIKSVVTIDFVTELYRGK